MKNLSEHNNGILFVFTAALLWSTGGLFIKLISFSAMQLSFFRCSIAALTFALLFRKQIIFFNKLSLINSIFYSIVLISFVIATKTTTAANAIFLQATAPIYVLIFEPLINKTRGSPVNSTLMSWTSPAISNSKPMAPRFPRDGRKKITSSHRSR